MNSTATTLYSNGISGPILWTIIMLILALAWGIFIQWDVEHPNTGWRAVWATLALFGVGAVMYFVLEHWLKIPA